MYLMCIRLNGVKLSVSFINLIALGNPPCPRAAHAASLLEHLKMVVYGGALGSIFDLYLDGGFASQELFLLNMSKGEANSSWRTIKTEGPTPGQRYGHSITYKKPFIVVFGGYCGTEPVNDVWILHIENMPFKWVKVNFTSELPPPRVYHTAALYSSGAGGGTIVIFGGRGSDSNSLSDSWELKFNGNDNLQWRKLPCHGDIKPTARFQVRV